MSVGGNWRTYDDWCAANSVSGIFRDAFRARRKSGGAAMSEAKQQAAPRDVNSKLSEVNLEDRSVASLGGKIAAASSAALTLAGCGPDGTGSSVVPPATPTPTPTPAPTPTALPLAQVQASRFLSQAAIGYRKSDVITVAEGGISKWLDDQFAMPRPQTFWDYLVSNGYNANTNENLNGDGGFDPMMWSQLIGSDDLLRQRVGLSLLNMWVVSIDGLTDQWRCFAMAAYLDILWNNAFGNYRDIMEQVSTNVAMSQFLTFMGSRKANPTTGSIPDENYARELMQLFTIGLVKLNPDGTPVTSGGNPIPTYSQEDVSQHARVWTGYEYSVYDKSTPDMMRAPLAVRTYSHETGPIQFLGISIPANHDGAAARKMALDGLFAHASLPPFVCKQLIQRMVTSNPSPEYVGRVTKSFIDNGSGIRGDMKAVIRAILTDAEARDDSQTDSADFGKLREPIIRLVQWARAFRVKSPNKTWPFGNTSPSSYRLAESPGRAPSVFNWFRPGYTPPGTAIASKGLVAPEFQITNEPSAIGYINYMQELIDRGAGEALPNYDDFTVLATDSQLLLNELNLVLAAGQISASTISKIKIGLDAIPIAQSEGLLNRIKTAVLLVMASPEYLVQR